MAMAENSTSVSNDYLVGLRALQLQAQINDGHDHTAQVNHPLDEVGRMLIVVDIEALLSSSEMGLLQAVASN